LEGKFSEYQGRLDNKAGLFCCPDNGLKVDFSDEFGPFYPGAG